MKEMQNVTCDKYILTDYTVYSEEPIELGLNGRRMPKNFIPFI